MNMTDCSCLIDAVKEYRQDNNPSAITTRHVYIEGPEIFKDFGFSADDYWPNVGCMVGLGVAHRIIGFIILAVKYRAANR